MRRTEALGRLLASVAVLAIAVLAGRRLLPEWRVARVVAPAALEGRLQELLAGGPLHPTDGPTARLVSSPGLARAGQLTDVRETSARMGDGARAWMARGELGLWIEIVGEATFQGDSGLLTATMTADGQLVGLQWVSQRFVTSEAASAPVSGQGDAVLRRTVLRPGEELGDVVRVPMGNLAIEFQPIREASPPEHVHVQLLSSPRTVIVSRELGSADDWRHQRTFDPVAATVKAAPRIAVFLAVAGLFAWAFVRRRLDMRNGALLAGLCLVTALLSYQPGSGAFFVLVHGASSIATALYVFLIWSAAESWIHSALPGFTTSLDALRVGRVGPRVGGALLAGTAAGGALAAVRLLLACAADAVPGAYVAGPTVRLPVAEMGATIPYLSTMTAAGVLLARALGASLPRVPARLRLVVAMAVATLLALDSVPIGPWPVRAVAAAASATFLLATFERRGLLALLVASFAANLWPAAILAATHPAWLGTVGAWTGGALAATLALGFVGLARPAGVEAPAVVAAPFLRRLEDERRLAHEQDLLVRMQQSLVPELPGSLPGFHVSARTGGADGTGGDLYDYLVDDAGHVWLVLAGVASAGHAGSIGKAMVKACFASLVEPERSPREVLGSMDRVLRSLPAPGLPVKAVVAKLHPSTGRAEVGVAGLEASVAPPEDAGAVARGSALGAADPVRVEETEWTLSVDQRLVLGRRAPSLRATDPPDPTVLVVCRR